MLSVLTFLFMYVLTDNLNGCVQRTALPKVNRKIILSKSQKLKCKFNGILCAPTFK